MSKQRSQESKKRIKWLAIGSILIIILFIATTYAWFSTQKNVSINNLKGKVESADGLKISLDAESWTEEINLGESESNGIITNKVVSNWVEYDTGIGNGTKNYRPIMNGTSGSGDETTGYMELVSSSGKIIGTSTVIPFYTGQYRGIGLSKIENITNEAEGGYYAFDIYIKNESKIREKSTFSEEQQEMYFDGNTLMDPLQLNFNSVVREIRFEDGTDYGLKNCVRVGMALYNSTADTKATKSEIISATQDATIKQVAIWEPNYDQHSETAMKQTAILKELAGDISVNAVFRKTYAIKTGTENGSRISNVYSENDANLEEQKVNKTSGNIVVGTINDVNVDANATGVLYLKDTNDNYVRLEANTISKMRIYIWIEGQDIDCVNWASNSNGIDVVLGLCKGLTVGATADY